MDHLKPNPDLYNVPFITDDFNGMPYRPLGRSGLRVSAVGLGTWKIGYPETGDGARVDEKTAFKMFDRAVELGVTFWDTANRYNGASGNSERVIGRWLARNPDQRRNVVIATKCFGGMDGVSPNHSRLSRANTLDSVRASRERLQIDHIDLLYFHSFDDTTPVEESLAAVEDLVQQDVIRYFAVSNFSADQLSIYQAHERSLSVRARVLAVQNQFDIVNREQKDPGVLDYCARTGISFVAYRPLARGLLTEKYLDLSKVGPGDRLYDEGLLDETGQDAIAKAHQLAEIAHGLDLTLNELALAYMLTLPGMGPLIPSASTVAQLESNAKAGRIDLSDETQSRIRAVLNG